MSTLTYAAVVKLHDQLSGPAMHAAIAAKQMSGKISAASKQMSSQVSAQMDTMRNSVEGAQDKLKSLNNAAKDFNGYSKLKVKIQKTSNTIKEATTQVEYLARKFKSTENPTAAFTERLRKARKKLSDLNEKQQESIGKLDTLRSRIVAAGVPMNSLIEAQKHLRTATDAATASLTKEQAALDKFSAKQQNLESIQKRVLAATTALTKEEVKQHRLALARQTANNARNQLQNRLQMQQDIAGVAYPSLAVGMGGLYAAAQPIKTAATQSDSIADIAITGNMSREAQKQLSDSLRTVALDTNQLQSEINKGVQLLVANGMSATDAKDYASLLGDTATASRAQMEDISNLTFSLQNNLKIKGKAAMETAMNNLVHAGKTGQFELKEMARYFPSLGAQMASMGATGQDAVKEIGIAMQAARKASGTSQEAAANMANWFSHMTSSSTIDHFDAAGIDLRKEMLGRMQNADPAKRMSAFRASIDVFDTYVDKLTAGKTVTIRTAKGKVKEVLNFKDALTKATKEGNEAEVKSIVERFGLSKVIQDMQTANFYLAMRQNKDFIDKGMKSFDAPDVQNTIDVDKARRMEEATEQWKQLKIQATDLNNSIGDSLLPTLKEMMASIKPMIESANDWVKKNPELTQTLLKVAIAGAAVIAAIGGLSVFIISILGPIALLRYSLTMMGLRFSLLSSTANVLRQVLPFIAKGIIWIGRAFLMNPIGLTITAIATAAYLLYTNWDKVTKYFRDTTWSQMLVDAANTVSNMAFYPLKIAMEAVKQIWEWLKPLLADTSWGQAIISTVDTVVGAFERLKAAYTAAKEWLAGGITTTITAIQTGGASIKSGEGVLGKAKAIGDRIFGKTAPDGARALGGPVRAGGLYEVAERAPEIYRQGNRAWVIANGARGGQVINMQRYRDDREASRTAQRIPSAQASMGRVATEMRGLHELTVNLRTAPGTSATVEQKRTSGNVSKFNLGKQGGAAL